jgi:hypothetical protein
MKTLPLLQALFVLEARVPAVAFVREPRACKLALFNMPL